MGRARKFERMPTPEGEATTVVFEGEALAARRGEPLAVTLLAHGIDIASRSVKYHRPRGPFCLANTCGQCWMRIDDVPNRPACTTPVHDGMTATRENAFPSADNDLLRAADFVFPGGLDHHRLGTTPLPALNALIGNTARQLAGRGELSGLDAENGPPIRHLRPEVLVVGGGPAGLAAARAARGAGAEVLLIDAGERLGGQLAAGLHDEPELAGAAEATRAALGEAAVWSEATALGVYPTDDAPLRVLARRRVPEDGLWILSPRALVLAVGGHEQPGLYEGNDLPGQYGARALARLVSRYGVLPGRRVAIVDTAAAGRFGARLQARLQSLGVEAVRLVERDAEPRADVLVGRRVQKARGRSRVSGLVHEALEGGDRASLACDLVAVCGSPAPAFELARQAGCRLEHRPFAGGFAVWTDGETGRSSRPGVFAAGELARASGATEAAAHGAQVGAAAASFARGGEEATDA